MSIVFDSKGTSIMTRDHSFDVAGQLELTDDNRLICPLEDLSDLDDAELAEELGPDYRRGEPWVCDTFGLLTDVGSDEDPYLWPSNSAFQRPNLMLEFNSPLADELFARGLVTHIET